MAIAKQKGQSEVRPGVMSQSCFEQLVIALEKQAHPLGIASDWAETIWAEDHLLAARVVLERRELEEEPTVPLPEVTLISGDDDPECTLSEEELRRLMWGDSKLKGEKS